jgi:hypothetical protein
MAENQNDPPGSTPSEGKDESLDRAKRRLLKLGVYVTPVLLGTLSLEKARAQKKSCHPSLCKPRNRP